MKVPLVDLRAQYANIRHEIEPAIRSVLEGADFILGAAVERFEQAFAEWVGTPHALGVANGTDAVEIALRAAGVRPGDDVLVPANTFVASAIGVIRAGGRPVYVDCTEQFLIDLAAAGKAITPQTRAMLPVHLCGRLVDPGALRTFARDHDLILVEDAAQAHGARSAAGQAGGIGLSASWSFYPGKNLGAYGDGGAVTTTSSEVAQRIAAFRNYGSPRKYEHPEFGVNSRLDTVQAAVLEVKLRHIETWNAARREAAAAYVALLRNVPDVILPEIPLGEEHVWHLFMVRVPRRDEILRRLHQAGVGAGIHYPTPVPFLRAVPGEARPGDFPVAERLAREVLSLPIYPEITEEQIGYVCDQLRRALSAAGA